MWSDLNLTHNYRQTQSDQTNNTLTVVCLTFYLMHALIIHSAEYKNKLTSKLDA